MKTSLFIQSLFLGCIILMGVSSYGKTLEENETALLDELRGYIQMGRPSLEDELSGKIKFEYTPRMQEVVDELTAIGSPNVVQFFLENIRWRRQPFTSIITPSMAAKVIDYRRDFPLVRALLDIKDVPLHQCVDAYMQKTEDTQKRTIEYVARQIHGDDFLREVEKLAETSFDPEQREKLKMQMEGIKPETVQPPVAVEKTQANCVPVTDTQPPPEDDKPAEPPDNIAEDEPVEGRATASPPSRLWLYALIPLALAILYFIRRKK